MSERNCLGNPHGRGHAAHRGHARTYENKPRTEMIPTVTTSLNKKNFILKREHNCKSSATAEINSERTF